MTTTQPEWYDRLAPRVADLDEKRGDGARKLRISPAQRSALMEAARLRGMSETAYIRRAVLAFVCHDLGIDWDVMMASEGPVRRAGHSAVYDKTPMRGKGFGRWRIERLR